MDGWWRWVWAGQTTRRVTLGAGGLSRGLRGILARHRISCSVRWLLACKRVLSHPPPSALPLHCFTGSSLARLPLGYSSYPLTCSNLTSTSPNVGLTSGQPATEYNSTFRSIAVDYQPNVRPHSFILPLHLRRRATP